MKIQSVVKWFDPKKGYGFILNPEDASDIFVHYTAIVSDAPFRTLRPDEPVTFVVEEGPKGLHAYEVLSLDPQPTEAPAGVFQAPRATADVPAPAPLPVSAPPAQRHA